MRISRREAGKAVLTGTAALAALHPALATAPRNSKPKLLVSARPEPFAFEPARTALLIIDMQNDFGHRRGAFGLAGIDIAPIAAVVAPIARTAAAARAARVPVIYLAMGFSPDLSDAGGPGSPNLVKHQALGVGKPVRAPNGEASRLFIRGTWNNAIMDELQPHPGDLVVDKTRYSGFYETTLDSILRQRGIESLIATGCTTSVCVDSTVRDAMYRNYRCLLLDDCMAEPIGMTEPRSNHQASLLVAQILLGWVGRSEDFIAALRA